MGLMNRGGFEYYGGPSGLSSGFAGAVDAFFRTKGGLEEGYRKQAEAEIMNKIRAQQLAEMQQAEAQKEQYQQGLMGLQGQPMSASWNQTGQKPLVYGSPEFKAAGGQAVNEQDIAQAAAMKLRQPSIDEQVNLYSSIYPEKGLALQATIKGQDDKFKLMDIKNQAAAEALAAKMQNEIEKLNLKNDAASKLLADTITAKLEMLEKTYGLRKEIQDAKEPKPTNEDKRYQSYVEEKKAAKEVPMSRYQFDNWYFQQTEGVKTDNKIKANNEALPNWMKKDTKKSSSPTKLTYNPATGQFE